MDIKLLAALLPVVFMLHDFEEIIIFKPWLEKNRDELKRRFPRIDKTLSKNHDHLSTSAYAVAVLHEFFIITVITYFSLYFGSYHWWFGAFAAFSLHLVVHLLEFRVAKWRTRDVRLYRTLKTEKQISITDLRKPKPELFCS